MSRVVHFELAADDMDRAVQFYRDIFGWQFQQWSDGYWLITTGDDASRGINGGLNKRTEPNETTTVIIDVKDLDESIGKIESNGGKVVVPRMAVPGVGYLAYGQDTEGNTFGMMQADSSAA